MKKNGSSTSRNGEWVAAGRRREALRIAGALVFGIGIVAGAGISLDEGGLMKRFQPGHIWPAAFPPGPVDFNGEFLPVENNDPAPAFEPEAEFVNPAENPTDQAPDAGQGALRQETSQGGPGAVADPQTMPVFENDTAPQQPENARRDPSGTDPSTRTGGIPAPPAPVIGRIPPPRQVPTPNPTPTPIFSPL
jgi:hypothetical protein